MTTVQCIFPKQNANKTPQSNGMVLQCQRGFIQHRVFSPLSLLFIVNRLFFFFLLTFSFFVPELCIALLSSVFFIEFLVRV